ncbi:MAG: CoA transferase [Chloroflexi bacterium]|nr:CoA transferase [Chloroflexota bacterium]
MALPLDGVRILALSQFGAGPFGTMHLADLGAEVIKIEDPTAGGDVSRYVPPFRKGQDSLYYQAFNRNKRSITLNLRVPQARQVLHDLVAVSDGFFSNLRGDQPERLGLTYRELGAINPRIVCCSLTGFGMTGPRRAEPGYDYLFQAYAGFMSLTGDPSTPPAKSGISIVDLTGGFVAALGLMVGLFQAQRTGRGCDVDVSLMDTALALLAYVATFSMNAGYTPPRLPDSAHPTIYPAQVFATSDGYVVVMVMKEKFWELLCQAMERDDLIEDPRFRTFDDRYKNRDELIPLLKEIFRTRTTKEWLDRLTGEVPCAPVNTVEQALQEPQILERNMIIEVDSQRFGRVRHVASPIKVGGGERAAHREAPDLGEDTELVLQKYLSYTPERLAELRACGAI